MDYRIYCDESCYLEHDNSNVMLLGAIKVPESEKNRINADIRALKQKHGLNSWFEIKWTKVSISKVQFYIEVINYFFNESALEYRSLVAINKDKLKHDEYNNNSHDEWYNKMYFYLLKFLISNGNQYRVFLDIKDTRGGPRINILHKVLANSKYDFRHERIKDIKQVNSRESDILQIVDLLTGALSFYHRNLHMSTDCSLGKKAILNEILERVDLSCSTPVHISKFNQFIWEPR